MYEAYSDYQNMMDMAEEIVVQCTLAVHGKLTVDYQVKCHCFCLPSFENVSEEIWYVLFSICYIEFDLWMESSWDGFTRSCIVIHNWVELKAVSNFFWGQIRIIMWWCAKDWLRLLLPLHWHLGAATEAKDLLIRTSVELQCSHFYLSKLIEWF